MKDEGERQALGFRLPPPSCSGTMADKLGSGEKAEGEGES